MDRSVSKSVSARFMDVSKRDTLSLVLGVLSLALAVVLWAGSALAGGGHGAIPVAPAGAEMAPSEPAQAKEPRIVLGCFSDADCVLQGICVKEEGASASDPGDCLPSFEEEDLDEQDTTGAEDPEEQADELQCAASPGRRGGSESIVLVSLAAALALARRGRRRVD